MNDGRLPQKMLEWCPPGRRRRKTSKLSDAGVTTGMREKGINNIEWIDRKEWKRKIKL